MTHRASRVTVNGVSDSAERLRWAFKVTTECADDVLIVTLIGRISARSAADLAEHIESPEVRRAHHVVLDMTGVDYVSSDGLLAIDGAAERARGEGRTLIVAGIKEAVWTALDLAGLLPKLTTEPTRQAALTAMRARINERS
jgi:anti-sigma B factor antagonist